VSRSQIDQRFFDTPYYITPNAPVGQEAFAVIREAMRRKPLRVDERSAEGVDVDLLVAQHHHFTREELALAPSGLAVARGRAGWSQSQLVSASISSVVHFWHIGISASACFKEKPNRTSRTYWWRRSRQVSIFQLFRHLAVFDTQASIAGGNGGNDGNDP
jgi:hypothetical protein